MSRRIDEETQRSTKRRITTEQHATLQRLEESQFRKEFPTPRHRQIAWTHRTCNPKDLLTRLAPRSTGTERKHFLKQYSLIEHNIMRYHKIWEVSDFPSRTSWTPRSRDWEDTATRMCTRINDSITIVFNGQVVLTYDTRIILHDTAIKAWEMLASKGPTILQPMKANDPRRLYQPQNQEATNGLAHIAAWYERGHKFKGLQISRESTKTSAKILATTQILNALETISMTISSYLMCIDPDHWTACRKAILKGDISITQSGPMDIAAGRAIIMNLPTSNHVDKEDSRLSAMICLGNYTGGELVLPDLRLRLAYGPGHFVICKTSSLIHFVARWKGTRITVVHFTHQSIIEI